MKSRIFKGIITFFCLCALAAGSVMAQDLKTLQLPEPKLDPSKSFVQVLKDRKTTREYQSGNLSEQVLANLLWSAAGINRQDIGKKTSPSAMNWQEIDIYVVTSDGAYVYDAKGNALKPVAAGDLRTMTGTQSYFKDAAINLVYVADLSKMQGDESVKMILAGMDTGFVAQNVYLYCAADNLATVYRVSMDKHKLGEALKLGPDQKIMGAQTVGLAKTK